MRDALQQDRLGSAVDTAERAPLAVPDPNTVVVPAKRPSRRMRPERVGQGLHPGEQRAAIALRQRGEGLRGAERDGQIHAQIVERGSRVVKDESCQQRRPDARYGVGWR